MTAINPARLRIQCAKLADLYHDPAKFIPGLHDLLGFYASRIRKTALNRTPLTLQTYQVAPPVLRALEGEMDLLVNTEPSRCLLLVDALWEEEWLEFRQFAVTLLGNIPPINAEPIFKRIKYWLSESTSETIRSLLPTRAVKRLKVEKPDLVLSFYQDLLSKPIKENCQAVLLGLIQFGQDQEFLNYPILFTLLGKILIVEEKGLVKEIQAVLKPLIDRSEYEVTYFLVQQISTASKPRITRVVRGVLPLFSADNQKTLKDALQKSA
jgi:hypothetical protein